MRIISVIILLLIVGGVGYLLVFQRDWLFKKAEEGKRLAQGYKAAETPDQAMENFRKAVQKRDYKTASQYCTSEYAEQLVKANDAARAMGDYIDKFNNYMKNKGLRTDKSTILLYKLDLFPTNFKFKEAKKVDDSKGEGVYELEKVVDQPAQDLNWFQSLDMKMFQNNLGASVFAKPVTPLGSEYKVDLVTEGADKKTWKLKVPLLPGQTALISHYLDKYPTYITGFERFWSEVNNGRYSAPKEFENELVSVLSAAYPK